jgi:NADPH-dependent 2,4-dienoyl-CoA reductase/sulfur reductase-like enzyme
VAEAFDVEVVVVGAGPAGLAATAHAAEAGANVLLLDRGARPGGQVWRYCVEPPRVARDWIDRVDRSGATCLFGATVVDAPTPGTLLIERKGRGCRVRYHHLVLATGARERFLPFPGWTHPGVIGVGAAQALLKQGARFEGQRVVAAGTGPLLLTVAAALSADGARVVGIAEQAPLGPLLGFGRTLVHHPSKVAQGLGYGARLFSVPYRTGSWVRSVEGVDGRERVRLTNGRREWTWECDVLACSYGLVPNLELPRLLGCETDGEGLVLDEEQRTTVPGVFAAGELGGIGGNGHALVTGTVAGLGAAGRFIPDPLLQARERERAFAVAHAKAFTLRDELRGLAAPETVVCRCEDVPLARVRSCRSSREAKLVSRAGMGPCQGRVCGPALSFLHGWAPDAVRSPLEPVPLSVLEDQTTTRPGEEARAPLSRERVR